jgi:hypothetical protein
VWIQLLYFEGGGGYSRSRLQCRCCGVGPCHGGQAEGGGAAAPGQWETSIFVQFVVCVYYFGQGLGSSLTPARYDFFTHSIGWV